MAVQTAEQLARLGRRLAEAQGFDASDPQVDWATYGRTASYNLSRRRGVPSPEAFRTGSGPPPAPPPRFHVEPSAATQQGRSVRIGSFELTASRLPEPPRHRPQHRGRPGERTGGRYRRRRGLLRQPSRRLRRRGQR